MAGLSGRDGSGSRRLLNSDRNPPCGGTRPTGGGSALVAYVRVGVPADVASAVPILTTRAILNAIVSVLCGSMASRPIAKDCLHARRRAATSAAVAIRPCSHALAETSSRRSESVSERKPHPRSRRATAILREPHDVGVETAESGKPRPPVSIRSRPTSKTGMEPDRCRAYRGGRSRSSPRPLPMQAEPATNLPAAHSSPSIAGANPRVRLALPCVRAGGRSSAAGGRAVRPVDVRDQDDG